MTKVEARAASVRRLGPAAVPLDRRRLAASVILTILPLAFLVVLVRRCYVDVPFWDEWEIVWRLEKLHRGTMAFVDLWGQHNEHRPLFGIVTLMMLVQASHWNVATEIAANLAAGVLIFGVFTRLMISQWPAAGRLPFWLLPLLSLLAFSPSQSENWLWGWQITIFLNVLAVVAGLSLMATLDGRWLRLVAAIICGIVATYTLAAGLIFWFTGSGAWCLNRGPRKPMQIAVWATVALLVMASYFYDYHSPPFHPTIRSNFVDFAAFIRYLAYSARYLGGPVAIYNPGWSGIAGCVGFVLFVWLAIGNRELAGGPVLTFPILVGVHCLGVALMTGLGRAGMGVNQALVSRYVTLSSPLWFSIAALAALRLSRLQRNDVPRCRRTIAQSGIIAAAIVGIAVSVVASGRFGIQLSTAWHGRLQPARQALIIGRDDGLLLRLYPDVPTVRQRRETLINWHLSVFRSARAQRDLE